VSRRWWRRNRWGLAALLPALAAAVGMDMREAYDRYWSSQPRQPIAASADGWVTFAGARMRLIDLTPAEELREYGGRPYTPPPGVRVWRAEIVFDEAARQALGACHLQLEDDAGRTFDAGPTDLRHVRIPLAGCAPPSAMAYFIAPASARPVAVRIVLLSKLPAYARLTTGGGG
jgi:hypothetical protein